VDDAGPELEAGTQRVYDHVRKSFGGLHLTPDSYPAIFTGPFAVHRAMQVNVATISIGFSR
jgi:hypothetical protein